MPRLLPLRLGLLLLAALALVPTGCGGSGENRPVVVTTVPPPGAVLDNVVEEFLVIYDQPVRILNPNQARGFDRRGQYPMLVFADDDHPNWLRVRPAPGFFLLPGSFGLQLGAGLEVNAEQHYRLYDDRYAYTFGEGSNLFLGSRGRAAVVEVDQDTFAEIDAVPTPGGRVPFGIRGTQIGPVVRIWVQLDAPSGGTPMAWYAPGDALMQGIPLTSGGGDLVSAEETLALGRSGVYLYVAFRDEALGQVRLTEIDARTAMESRTLLLSAPAGPGTEPVSVRSSPLGGDILVTCRTDVGDELLAVNLGNFEERNLGAAPGDDGFDLQYGAGALATWGDLAIVANQPEATGALTAVHWTPPVSGVGYSPSRVAGHPTDVSITPDGLWLVTALADFEEDRALVRRSRAVFYDPIAQPTATTTSGANPAATTVRKFVPYRTQARFLTLFDNDAAGLWTWSTLGLTQIDVDDGLDGIQAVDLSAVAPDAVSGTFVSGYFPP